MIQLALLAVWATPVAQNPVSLGSEYELTGQLATVVTGSAPRGYDTTPSGDQVVFMLNPGTNGRLDLCVSATDGSTPERVIQGGFSSGAVPSAPFTIDPTGTRIAYSNWSGEPGVWVASLATGAPPVLVDATTISSAPSRFFTPDGTTLVFRTIVNAANVRRWVAVRLDARSSFPFPLTVAWPRVS